MSQLKKRGGNEVVVSQHTMNPHFSVKICDMSLSALLRGFAQIREFQNRKMTKKLENLFPRP